MVSILLIYIFRRHRISVLELMVSNCVDVIDVLFIANKVNVLPKTNSDKRFYYQLRQLIKHQYRAHLGHLSNFGYLSGQLLGKFWQCWITYQTTAHIVIQSPLCAFLGDKTGVSGMLEFYLDLKAELDLGFRSNVLGVSC